MSAQTNKNGLFEVSSSGRTGAILSRYVKKTAFFAMLLAILGLWGLQIVFAYLSEVDNLSDTYTFLDAFRYILYRSPYFLEQFIATGALLGAVVGMGLLANNSELITMRAAGVSTFRIVGWVLQPAVLFVLIALAVNQFVLPTTNILASRDNDVNRNLPASIDGYWTLKNTTDSAGNNTGSQIVYIDYADAEGNVGQVKRYQLDINNNLTSVSAAQEGTYIGTVEPSSPNVTSEDADKTVNKVVNDDATVYQWQLDNISTLDLSKGAIISNNVAADNTVTVNSAGQQDQSTAASIDSATYVNSLITSDTPLATQQTKMADTISLPIAPNSVSLLTRSAEDLSLTQLFAHRQLNASQGRRSLEHEVAFWQKLLSPFAIFSLVLVACSFVFGSLRSHSLGLRIVVALLFGLLFSYMQDLVGFFSLATGISPFLMVLLPIIGSAILGLYLLKRKG